MAYLADVLERTIRHGMREESRYLRSHARAKAAIKDIVDLRGPIRSQDDGFLPPDLVEGRLRRNDGYRHKCRPFPVILATAGIHLRGPIRSQEDGFLPAQE